MTAETATSQTATAQTATAQTATAQTASAPTETTQTASPGPASPVATVTDRDGKGILITETAVKQLGQLIGQQGDNKVLRVGVRSGGCSGMSYTMDFIEAEAIRPDDASYAYEPEGVAPFRVVCDPKSLLYIYGMQLDFSTSLIGGGFNFTNPNATQTCGCGSSFNV